MKNKSVAIRINGQGYTEEEVSLLISKKLFTPQTPEWEKELYTFLREWFSPTESISVQTSGSTGEPQTIQLPKKTMLRSANRTIEFFGLQKGSRILLSLPCRFIGGKMMVVRAIVGQFELVIVDPGSNFDFLINEVYDFGAMVPNQVYKLLNSPSGQKKIENIHHLMIGGASIQSSLETQVSQLTNHVVSTYGMTETASHIAIRTLSGENRSMLYHCLPGISVSKNNNNCLQIHTDEWPESLQTKDIAKIISPTIFEILGRADDVIISGGIKYYPETIEKKLEFLINRRFVISSLPDEKLGDKLVLVIEGEPFPTDNLLNELKTFLLPYEHPKEIAFLDHFPETSNGKVKRNEIKEAIHRF